MIYTNSVLPRRDGRRERSVSIGSAFSRGVSGRALSVSLDMYLSFSCLLVFFSIIYFGCFVVFFCGGGYVTIRSQKYYDHMV